jgi:hypothetical protein
MNKVIATMSAVLLCLAGAANAGDARSHGVSGRNMSSKSQTVSFGVDSDFSLPMSTYGDVNGPGLGALLTVEYPMIEQLSLTARAGFEFHLDKSPIAGVDSHVHAIPVLFGAKYYVLEKDRQGLFAAAEMGLFTLMTSASSGGASGSSTDMKFGIGAGVGYQWNEWNFRLNLHSHDIGNFGDLLVVSGGVGYQFAGI